MILLTRDEFIRFTNEKTGVAMVRLNEALDAITESIIAAISDGEEIKLRGLGTFKVKYKKETKCSNPRKPGEIMVVPGKAMLKFIPSGEMTKAIEKASEHIKS